MHLRSPSSSSMVSMRRATVVWSIRKKTFPVVRQPIDVSATPGRATFGPLRDPVGWLVTAVRNPAIVEPCSSDLPISTTLSTASRTTNARPLKFTRLIGQHKRAAANDLLDVACGTGKHLTYLQAHYACEGMDLDARMGSAFRARHARIPFHRGDLVDFDLGKQYGAVICLFSSIGTFDRARVVSSCAIAGRACHEVDFAA